MACLSLASSKGGCGKTTLAILIGSDLALMGYSVTLLDCDLNQHASAFGGKTDIPGFTVMPSIDEASVLQALREAESVSDVVLVDLPGGSSTLALKALQRSNFVLIPCQASLPDVRDAVRTVAQVDDAQELARFPIARSLIWTRVLPGFESRSARHVRQSVEGASGLRLGPDGARRVSGAAHDRQNPETDGADRTGGPERVRHYHRTAGQP
jgi:chromosome partitioning protein